MAQYKNATAHINCLLADFYRTCERFELLQANLAVHHAVRQIYLDRAACYRDLIEHAEVEGLRVTDNSQDNRDEGQSGTG